MTLLQGMLFFGVTIASLCFGIWFYSTKGWVDNPKKYGFSRAPVPYSLGVVVFLLYFASLLFFPVPLGVQWPMVGFFLASMLLVVTCWFDDRYSLSPFFRLGIQCIVAMIIVGFGVSIPELRIGIEQTISLTSLQFDTGFGVIEVWSDLLVIFWLLACMNVMNWLDGVTGLVSGSGMVASLLLGVLALSYGQYDIATIIFPLSIICFACVLFEIDPPKFLLGDTGSMFIGLALGVFSCIAGGKIATLVIVGLLPFCDALFTVLRRILSKQSPFKGDLYHFHHLFLLSGISRRSLVLLYVFFAGTLGSISLYLQTFGKLLLVLIVGGGLLCLQYIFFIKNTKNTH